MPKPSMRLALVLSLAFNLFLAAVLVAPWVLPRSERAGDPGRFAARLAERLPEADRTAFQDAYKLHAPAVREGFEAGREARERARAALAAEPFDRQSAEAAFADWRKATEATQTALHAAILEAAPHLSPEGRSRLVRNRGRR